jgi:AraC family transcriptional regulator, regulatory protein of adaptative response / methylated-DNA-[protein]-cysteine methyltransferase
MRITTQAAWNAVLHHDPRMDGTFVYAVSSTGVYCRPSCPSRRPARHRVAFFPSPQSAEAAGFRACLRCKPRSPHSSRIGEMMEQARRFLEAHVDEPITLRRLAERIGLSPCHLQRTFTRVVGLSPRAYQAARRMERFRASLKRGETVTNAIYDAGFGSGSRLYARAHSALGMTPSVFRAGGAGVTLRYTTVPTAVGRLLIAVTDRGIAAVSVGDSHASLLARLKGEYPHATIRRAPQALHRTVRLLLKCLDGPDGLPQLPLDLQGTVFQRKVWQALQQIPRGSTRSYREIAHAIGHATAVRAVARACAANPIALAIPCHRVVREDGTLAGYRWGLLRKRLLLVLERDNAK